MNTTTQKIVPHLWFDKEAEEAAKFYVSVFGKNSKVNKITTLHNTPSGDAPIVPFELWGFKFMSISAGPIFKPNPSVSFIVNFDPAQMNDAAKRIDEIWKQLSEGGKILMPLEKYPFSEKYGWVEDRYGVSWQLMLTDPEGDIRPLIIPSLLFVGDVSGKAEEAVNFYIDVFKGWDKNNSEAGFMVKYPAGSEPNEEGTVMFTDFKLAGVWMAAMDSALPHDFNFNEGVSLMVYCKVQEELDYYWQKLSADPKAEQCGWLKDKFGLSWQIVPERMDEMMTNGTREQIDNLTKAFLPMKKLNIAVLEEAYKEGITI